MELPKITINSQPGQTTISVDGVSLGHCVASAEVRFDPDSLPEVTLRMAARQQTLDLTGAALKIGGIEAPEALERAMLEYLRFKYPEPHEEGRPAPAALRESIRAAIRQIAAPIAEAINSGDWAKGGMIGGGPCTFKVGESFGSGLPMMPTIVQIGEAAELAPVATADSAPSGLTRAATDGERNGRLGWTPGA